MPSEAADKQCAGGDPVQGATHGSGRPGDLGWAEGEAVFSYKTVDQGAATTLVAAVAPEFAHAGGRYLDDGREAYAVPDDATLAQHPHGVKQWALDPAAADELWRRSLEMTG